MFWCVFGLSRSECCNILSGAFLFCGDLVNNRENALLFVGRQLAAQLAAEIAVSYF